MTCIECGKPILQPFDVTCFDWFEIRDRLHHKAPLPQFSLHAWCNRNRGLATVCTSRTPPPNLDDIERALPEVLMPDRTLAPLYCDARVMW